MTITKDEAKQLLLKFRKEGKGRFFSALFVKKDKSYRHMLGRFGVRKWKGGEVKGTGQQWDEAHQAIQVWDAQKQEYRSISTERLIRMKLDGTVYEVM